MKNIKKIANSCLESNDSKVINNYLSQIGKDNLKEFEEEILNKMQFVLSNKGDVNDYI